MRILRIRLKNYRGVDDLEVRLPPTGVTVLQGPNEVGKSSLAEAIDLLFEHLDSTTRQEVRSIKPVDRDTGTEIEVDVETGPYKFTYFKRFHRDRETTLRVDQPRPENWTGREAHARAREILEETMDVHLWRALQVQQGMGLEQPRLADQTSLSAALDRAAGGSVAGPREETLFEAVCTEYGRYYTETGRERAELSELDRAFEDADREVDSIHEEVRKLEANIERNAQLKREIAGLERSVAELEKTAIEHERRLESVTRMKNQLGTLEALRDNAVAEEASAQRDMKEREGFVSAAAEARKKVAELSERRDAEKPALDEAQQDFQRAAEELKKSREQQDTTVSLLKLRQEDYEFRRDELDLAQLEERKGRIDKAIKDASVADAILARIRITDDLLDQIQKANVGAERAKARLESASPSVRIEALSGVAPKVDGKRIQLTRGEKREYAVVDSLRLIVPDVFDLTITAGTSAAALAESIAKAEEKLKALCAEAGVKSPEEAVRMNEERREAGRKRAIRDQALKDNLRDLSLQKMEQKILDLRLRVAQYPKNRPSKPPLPPDLDTAKVWLAQAKDGDEKARRSLELAAKKHEASQTRFERLQSAQQEIVLRRKLAEEALTRADENLKRARSEVLDEKLAERVAVTSGKVRELQQKVLEGKEKLEAEGPERIEALARNGRTAVTKANEELRKTQDELIAVEARLKEHGEEGLSERLDAATGQRERVAYQREGLRRRAAAAKLLYDTMRSAREEARQKYMAPLRSRIEKLARFVFGDTFAVEMDENLQVVSRTIDGRTIPFQDLSGGAKEQLSVILRLACALTVTEDGGVPIILDDALGYSDPQRLEEMSAVLSLAGRQCQVVILTCVPERYRHVGDAHVTKVS